MFGIKGSYVRNRADWYIQRLAATKLYQPQTSGQYTYVGLFNNATDGSNLYLVHAAMTSGFTGTVFFGALNQNLFTATSPTHMIYPIAAVIPGQVGSWTSATNLFNTGGTSTPAYFEVGSLLDESWEWPADFPLMVIPPGWTGAFQQRAVSQDMGMSFWWTALK